MENENINLTENSNCDYIQNDNINKLNNTPIDFETAEPKSAENQIQEKPDSLAELEHERSLRQQYEEAIFELAGKDLSPQTIQAQFEYLAKNKGEAYANQWLNSQLKNYSAVQTENQSVLRNIQTKYQDIYAVPEVKQAIDAYLKLDMNPNESLKEQGFEDAVQYISSIYKAGYESALRMKNENDSAKSRLQSSVNFGVPSSNMSKTFTRSEIAAMDTDTFSKYEKIIFDQMAKGLIK
jgi:hypothetical protein